MTTIQVKVTAIQMNWRRRLFKAIQMEITAIDGYSSGGGGFMISTGQGCVLITGYKFENITQKGDANDAGG
jgi:hypothetical protein